MKVKELLYNLKETIMELRELIAEKREDSSDEDGIVTLRYNLGNPHAASNFKTTMKAQDLLFCIDDLRDRLFNKHGPKDAKLHSLCEKHGYLSYNDCAAIGLNMSDHWEPTDKDAKDYTTWGHVILEQVREVYYETLSDRDVNLDEMMY